MRTLAAVAMVVLLGAVSAASAQPAESPDAIAALRQEVEALREGQTSIRAQLDEIKALLEGLGDAAPAAAPAARSVPVDIAGAPFRGAPDAPVTLVEFSDFGCPFCSRHVRETWPELDHYVESGQVKHVFVDYPIEQLHPLAFRAHEAARCAGDQDRYWEMHAHLFTHQDAQEPPQLIEHAETLGLDMAAFASCFEEERYAGVVQAAVDQARRLQVNATPTFLLGATGLDRDTLSATRVLVGAKPVGEFVAAIDELLGEQ